MATAARSVARTTIPAGTPAEKCERCDWTVFYVVAGGCRMPFDVRDRGCFRPSSPTAARPWHGEGVAHLARCPGRKD